MSAQPTETEGPKGDRLKAHIAIVGAGPGGAVTAALLAEAGHDVLLIESGPHLPLNSASRFTRDEMSQKYRNGGITPAFGKVAMAYVEGCCVGGGSEINRGLYHRTPDSVVESWRRNFQVDGISPDFLIPHFEACETTAKVSFLPGAAPPNSLKLQEGCDALGWKCLEVPRLATYYTSPDDSVPSGRKQSMSVTFVPRFVAAGGRLVTDTSVRRFRRVDGRWFLTAERNRRALEIEADILFVAGGAIHTPALLKRSGVTRNIGGNLRFHPMIKVVARFPDEINLPNSPDPVHQVKEFDPRFSMGCSMSSRSILALTMTDHPSHITEVDHHWRHMAIYYVQSTGGVGRVDNLPGFHEPFVRVRFSDADLAELAEGLKRLCECLFAAGAETIYPAISDGPVLRGAGDIDRLPQTLPDKRVNISTLHLFATCPMGENESRCATNSFGKVHGVDGLYVADASLLPSPTVVNPQGSVMAVAHRNALNFINQPR